MKKARNYRRRQEMGADLVIKNGVVCTENGMFKGGLAVKDGIIQALGDDGSLPPADKIYDAKGNFIFPGIIEMHSHLGLDRQTPDCYARDLETETKAAAQGGITTVCTTTLYGDETMSDLLDSVLPNIKNLYSNIKFTATPGREDHIAEQRTMFERGSVAYKYMLVYRGEAARMFGNPEEGISTAYMYRGFSEIAKLGAPAFAMIHAEDPDLVEWITPFVEKENMSNLMAAYHKARPSMCEVVDISKAAYIANEVGCRLYTVHVSAKESVDQIEYFKAKGHDIVAETCIHYLLFDCHDEVFNDNEKYCKLAKVNPPIREKADQDRLWKALNDGTIECVGTDHVNYRLDNKLDKNKDFWKCICGCGDGMSVSLSLMFSEGVNKGRITIDTLRKVMSENPAKIFGLYPRKGTLAVGSDADIVIIDPRKEMVIDHNNSESTNEFSLYQDWKVKGVPVATFVNGDLVAENYKIVTEKPSGDWLNEPGLPVKIGRTHAGY
jgi:dihydropyrimidinase